MRRILIKVILLTCLVLVGCSTNTQNQNTAAGLIMGGAVGGFAGNAVGRGSKHGLAIGTGAVAGAIIGAAIGHYIDSSDHNTTYPFLSKNYAIAKEGKRYSEED